MRVRAEIEDLRLRLGRGRTGPVITWSLGQGVTALLGPNGVGKTTLLSAMTSQQALDRNLLRLFLDEDPVPGGVDGLSGLIGVMPQESRFFSGFTVTDVLAYQGWLKGLDRTRTQQAVQTALERVRITHLAHRRANKLSGGEKRSVSLAEAIVSDPVLLLLDEPTVGLDPTQRRRMREVITTCGAHAVVVMTSHLLDDVATTATALAVMDRNGITFTGTPAELASLAPAGGSLEARLADGYEQVLR